MGAELVFIGFPELCGHVVSNVCLFTILIPKTPGEIQLLAEWSPFADINHDGLAFNILKFQVIQSQILKIDFFKRHNSW